MRKLIFIIAFMLMGSVSYADDLAGISERASEFIGQLIPGEGHTEASIDLRKNNKPDLTGANFTQSFTGDKLLKFAYDSDVEPGDLIGAPIKDKNKYVIVYLSLKTEKGEPSFEDAKFKMKEEMLKQRKFDITAKKIA